MTEEYNRPTPRTDKAAYDLGETDDHRDEHTRWCDLLNTSRELERELADAKRLLEDIHDAYWGVFRRMRNTASIPDDILKHRGRI